MPIKHALWTVSEEPKRLRSSGLDSEEQLERMIKFDSRILSDQWMLIGQQLATTSGGRLDLLAIAPDASMVLIELKRNKTPRDVVAQALDYATWVEQLTPDQIARIYRDFTHGGSLGKDFLERFGTPLDEDELNRSHQIIICASEMDAASERIVSYLNSKDIPVNVLFFQVFSFEDERLLTRAWLIDPRETQENVANVGSVRREKEPWNGEFYGSFGDSESRSWEEARRHGFFCAGGGSWYSQTLASLDKGDRIWVRLPQKGYVGVGIVEEPVVQADEFELPTSDGLKPALEILTEGTYHREHANDPELAEYFVKIRWLETVPASDAVHEVGMFGNQNSVARPTNPKWRHTVDRLKTIFAHWNEAS